MSTFRSESPSQVFLLAIHYLYRRLKDVPEHQWEEFILSYDNMCNVCRMLCTKKPLPLNPPFDKIWLKVTKAIDRLHLRNHKNKECHQIFSPEPFKGKNPILTHPSQSRFSPGLHDLKKFFVQCRRRDSCFIIIVWWLEETATLHDVIGSCGLLFYQK